MAEQVLVAMSGGVDSAVAALLLQQQGYEVIGVNLRLWEYKVDCNIKVRAKSCCSPEDISDAAFVAQRLGIPFYVIRMEEEFRKTVIQDFVSAYQKGRTPNPCVNCNTFVKFGELYTKASQLGIRKIATGHYARTFYRDGRWSLLNGVDAGKNQTYYLYGLSQQALADTIFPLGEMKKTEVRRIAEEHNLPVASKSESQDICFIPENNYRNFLKKQGLVFQPGRFLDTRGKVLGQHDGKENFTIGQRKGLGLAMGEPVYVREIRRNGDVVVAKADEMGESGFRVSQPNFMLYPREACEEWKPAMVQIRSRHYPVPCKFRLSGDSLEVRTLAPEDAITPGQSAVLYEPEEVIGQKAAGNETMPTTIPGPVIAGGLIERETS